MTSQTHDVYSTFGKTICGITLVSLAYINVRNNMNRIWIEFCVIISFLYPTGIILSGNEISQILSLILTYYGGSGHRPRWIAVGVGFSALSCIVLALPHFMYGPGKDALALTKEYLDHTLLNTTTVPHDLAICPRTDKPAYCDAETMLSGSLLPRLLIFISQFILGIGTTLYYGLGQTYLDDNTKKKKNIPMLLGDYRRNSPFCDSDWKYVTANWSRISDTDRLRFYV